jgi:hypothetical protein
VRSVASEIFVTDVFVEWYGCLSASEQESVQRVIGMLEEAGVTLPFPYSSGINGSKHSGMRELRIQHGGHPYRVLYAFDPARNAMLLIGGKKTGTGNRWYEQAIRLADRLFEEYLRER